jgi:hypothetical protein
MLFTAYERTAYAELLAAAWIPLLLHAILRGNDKGGVTIPRVAIPVALLWLTNAPAAVMSCYALALLTVIRLAKYPGAPRLDSEMWASRANATAPVHSKIGQTRLQLSINTLAGTALGLGLASFYLLPAAYERRYVQIAMAIIPNMRIQDNFLFHHTGDGPHDQVLHTASLIALILTAITAVTLAIPYVHRRRNVKENWPLLSLTTLAVTIPILLTPITATIWNHAPELAFLQFPWRLLAILAAVLALTLGLALTPLNLKPVATVATALAIAAALTYPAYAVFHQACDEEDTVPARLALFHSNQGTDPTDEYTPTTADNDSLAHADPNYWLSPNPNAKAPANATSGPAPTHINLNSPVPQTLILNLRNYPAWRVTLNGALITTREQRDDGLIAFPVPAGTSTITIAYVQAIDQTIGDIISLAALALLLIAISSKSFIEAS